VDHLRAAGRHDRAVSFSSFGRDGEDEFAIAEWLTASGELVGASKPDDAPDAILSSKETRRSIDDAIAALDPTERSVIVLAYTGGLSQSEIAAKLGWPLGTVKTRTRRALGRLREMLEAPVDLDASLPGGPDRGEAVADAAPPRPRVVRTGAGAWNLAARPASAGAAANCCS
jgi:DNA-directed RNA polymerase specialized sigma24 family protein